MPDLPKNIVWIASYPKSGNTWVRFMACNLLFGRQESAATLNTLVPDIHEVGTQPFETSRGGLVKTHFAYSSDLPLAERTIAAIYVVREPADVLVSNFYYSRRSSGQVEDSRAAFDRYFDTFLQHRGDPRWIELGMGSWESNVRSWLQPHAFPMLRLRFEDISADPRAACGLLAQLLRPHSSAVDIDDAVASSSFDRMREVEDADINQRRIGIFYKPYLQAAIDSGRRFMRSGTVGGGARLLSPEQQSELRITFGPLLQALGY